MVLKGPAAKNHKPWNNETKTEQTIVMKSEVNKLQGPAAKNSKVWSTENQEIFSEVAVISDRPALKGPAAKNHKVWMNDTHENSVLVKNNKSSKTK
ncbi:hypothetical protein [Reichenbachiella ulvae]|uniref:Hypervirulence associated protein TUDOR domain-containing protein n=1 Tax=Reichenbachiella ulvae TaxID=2980104 RepID=A0ABT3CQV6_9BACT|nr:hypothetical protein [Reichenbachiella ulvae]MCV9386024.1 hypothetical protein [Reichenbachiella ulvae]